MTGETLIYEADGLTMRGALYRDPAHDGPRPGILVFPEAFGLGEHAMARAARLAARGYVALACDLHGERIVHDDFPTVMALIGALRAEPARLVARAQGALDALLAQPGVDASRVAAIGYCLGGTIAFEFARAGAPIRAAIGFHSGLAPFGPAAAPGIAPSVLACIGADDPSVDLAQRNAFEDEMRAAGADWQLTVYGGVVHSFTDPDADRRGAPDFARYDARADRRSWAEMIALFDEVFGAAG